MATCSTCPNSITEHSKTGQCVTCRAHLSIRAASAARTLSVPADFAEVSGRLNIRDAAAHFGVGKTTISRWRTRLGIIKDEGAVVKPVPADFATIAPTMTQKQIAEHYGVTRTLVGRWCQRSGIASQGRVYQVKIVEKPRHISASPSGRYVPPPRHMDGSPAGIAAEFLRKWGPIYRCDHRGQMQERGNLWRYGNVILTDAEVIERAERKGYVSWDMAA